MFLRLASFLNVGGLKAGVFFLTSREDADMTRFFSLGLAVGLFVLVALMATQAAGAPLVVSG